MAAKKVYFYKIDLYKVDGNTLCPYTDIKRLIIDIINNNSIENNGFKTLDLCVDDSPLHVMMDIFNYDNERLFCRLSKQRPNNSVIKRNYVTTECSNVFQGDEIGSNGIESYTYGCIDYNTGIYSYVSAQSAPSEKVIANMFLKFNNEYGIEMISIPNADAIETIYYGEDPEVSKIEVEIPVPNDDIMKEIFKWDEDEVTRSVTERAVKASIIICPPQREKLVGGEDARKVIEKMKDCIDLYRKAKLTAKARGIKSREYDLYEKYFSFPIDIAKYHMRNNQRIEYTIDELKDIYRQNLIYSFETNRTILINLTGRGN